LAEAKVTVPAGVIREHWKTILTVIVMVGVLVAVSVAYALYERRKEANSGKGFCHAKRKNWIVKWWVRHCPVYSAAFVRNGVLLADFTVGGFAALWFEGYIQPILKSLVAYVYVMMVIVGFLIAVLGEYSKEIFQALNEIQDAIKLIMDKLHEGEEFLTGHIFTSTKGKAGSDSSSDEAPDVTTRKKSRSGCC
jgi:hypothetical protein